MVLTIISSEPLYYTVWQEILAIFLTGVEYVSLLPMHSKTPFKPMDEKNPQHLIHHSLGPPYSPFQTAAQLLYTLIHSYATKSQSPLVTMGCPYPLPKLPLPVEEYHSNVMLPFLGATWPTTPNSISIISTITSQYTTQTNHHRQNT